MTGTEWGVRGTVLLKIKFGTRWQWVVNAMPLPSYSQGTALVPNTLGTRWASGPVLTCMEKRTPTGFRTQDCPACSKSLPHPSPQNLYCEFSLYLLHRYRNKEDLILCYSITLYQLLKLLSIECLKMTS